MDHPSPVRPGQPAASSARRRARALGAGALVAAVVLALLAGCGTVRAFTDLDGALRDAGFTSTRVNVAGSDPVALTVRADAPAGDSTEEGQDAAAELVWTTFPRRFDEARITIDGQSRTVTPAQLQERFGDRPAGLDDQTLGDDFDRIGIGIVLGVLVAGVLAVGIAGLVALVVVRRRRRRRPPPLVGGPPAPWAPTAGPVPPPGGWGPPQAPPVTPSPPTAPSPTAPPAPPPSAPDDPTSPAAATPPPWTPAPLSHREARADARRRGRPVRGPRPPSTQLPPGWG